MHVYFSKESFSYLQPYSGPSIIMGGDLEITTKWFGRIDLNNGYFNNVLFVPKIEENTFFVYQMTHTGSAKRVTFT